MRLISERQGVTILGGNAGIKPVGLGRCCRTGEEGQGEADWDKERFFVLISSSLRQDMMFSYM